MDQTALGLSTSHNQVMDLVFQESDREILRKLAVEVAHLASRPSESEKRLLWTKHNDLETVRPLIFCDPENGWNEIIPENTLLCLNSLARSWEMTLRKEIFWATRMGDDRVTEPFFNIPYTYSETDWGMHHVQIGGENFGAYTWDPPLKDYATGLKQLKFPVISVDYKTTADVRQLAEELFGGLLTIRVKGMWWWTLGMTWPLINLRGLENFMLDFCLHPEELHRLMEILRDGHMSKLDFLEENNLLPDNTDMYIGAGAFGYTTQLPQPDFSGKVRTIDMWGFGESQETVSVDPEMFNEFILPYQMPILERFGLNCYGCCEPLELRWKYICKIPRLRRLSVSPWADEARMAEQLGSDYVWSRKLNPANLACYEMDKDLVRREIRRALEVSTANNCVIELIMKDNNTLGRNPQNAIDWCRIAREEIERL